MLLRSGSYAARGKDRTVCRRRLRRRRVAEIQTGQPGRLLPKLRFFLSEGLPVTVVYPMAGIKHLRWIDPETGEITKPRKSGKKERPIDAFHALYPLRELLLHPGLTVELLFFELDEYRLLCGYARERKKGSARIERIPRKLLCRKTLYLAEDYLRIFEEIPNLSEPFTAADLQKAAKLRSRPAYSVAHLLEALGLLKKVGMQKRAQLYGRCGSASSAPSPEADVHICDLKRNQI